MCEQYCIDQIGGGLKDQSHNARCDIVLVATKIVLFRVHIQLRAQSFPNE